MNTINFDKKNIYWDLTWELIFCIMQYRFFQAIKIPFLTSMALILKIWKLKTFVYKTTLWMMSRKLFFFSNFSGSKILCPTPIGKKYLTYHEDLKRHFATTTFDFDHWNVSEEQALRVKIRSVEVPISINWYRRKRYQKVWKPLR